MIITLPRLVRDISPDVLFCPGNSYTIVAVALKVLLGKRCPPVIAKISNDLRRADMPWPIRRLYGIWLRIQGRFLDHFVAMEASLASEIIDAIRPRPGSISIIPTPALSRRLISELRSGRPARLEVREGRRFVAVGRLAPQKNVALMLCAFARGAYPEDRLTIIGDGPERRKLETLTRRLRLWDRVEFRGYVSDPTRLLSAFDIFLLSSDYEGVPAVILEALAADLPVIATDCSRSMRALLGDGQLGTIVPVGDEQAMADAIALVSRNSQHSRLSLAQAERFTIEEAADAYLHTMRRLSGLSPSPQKISRHPTEVTETL